MNGVATLKAIEGWGDPAFCAPQERPAACTKFISNHTPAPRLGASTIELEAFQILGIAIIQTVEDGLLEFITEVYDFMGWAGVVVMMAIESAAIPLPSEIIMPLAGWKLILERESSAWFLILAGFYGALGNLLGSLVAYYVGAKGGRPILERYGRYVLITRKDLDRADGWFEKRGELTVFATRLLPVVRTFISVPAGISRMNIWKFSIYTFLGAFPWSLGLAYGGYKLGENWEDMRAVLRPFDIPIILIVVALVAWYIRHKLKELKSEAAADA